jgi:hypothetical protein
VNSFDELKMLTFPVREYERKIELQHRRIKRRTRPPKRSIGVCEGALLPFPILLFIHIFFINQMEHAPQNHEDEHEHRKEYT